MLWSEAGDQVKGIIRTESTICGKLKNQNPRTSAGGRPGQIAQILGMEKSYIIELMPTWPDIKGFHLTDF
jgi:hypothetical protein